MTRPFGSFARALTMWNSHAFVATLALGYSAPIAAVPTPFMPQGILGGVALAEMLPHLRR